MVYSKVTSALMLSGNTQSDFSLFIFCVSYKNHRILNRNRPSAQEAPTHSAPYKNFSGAGPDCLPCTFFFDHQRSGRTGPLSNPLKRTVSATKLSKYVEGQVSSKGYVKSSQLTLHKS